LLLVALTARYRKQEDAVEIPRGKIFICSGDKARYVIAAQMPEERREAKRIIFEERRGIAAPNRLEYGLRTRADGEIPNRIELRKKPKRGGCWRYGLE
jgi:hypothetical protein